MLPLFVQPVDSNDSLYGGDSKLLAENSKLCEVVMAQILEHLKILARDEVGTCLLHLPHALEAAQRGRYTTEGRSTTGHIVLHCGRETNLDEWWFPVLALAILCLRSTSPTPTFQLTPASGTHKSCRSPSPQYCVSISQKQANKGCTQ